MHASLSIGVLHLSGDPVIPSLLPPIRINKRRRHNPAVSACHSSIFSSRQVHSTQRNIAANLQRKFVITYCVPAGYEGGQLTGTPPVEMTGVLMTSVSPSGASQISPASHYSTRAAQCRCSARSG